MKSRDQQHRQASSLCIILQVPGVCPPTDWDMNRQTAVASARQPLSLFWPSAGPPVLWLSHSLCYCVTVAHMRHLALQTLRDGVQ